MRGDLHVAYIISKVKQNASMTSAQGDMYIGRDNEDEEGNECMLSIIAQIHPRGWIWKNFNYQYNFLRNFMMHGLDIRDAMEANRFLPVHFDPIVEAPNIMNNSCKSLHISDSPVVDGTMATIPPPALAQHFWTESDASCFKVRGASYNSDKVKVSSDPSLFKLIAIDVFEVPEPAHNIAAHPKNRVHLALQRGEATYVFVMNIMVPGSPNLSFVAYFAMDRVSLCI